MREYRTAEEIREDAKQSNIARYKKLANMFANDPSMEISAEMSDLALVLVKSYGLTWGDIDTFEIA